MRNVRYWPLADMPRCTANVRFRGSSGHDDCSAKCPLMTQSGHGASGWVSVSKAAVCLAGAIWEAFSLVLAAALPEPLARLRRR